MFSGSLVAIVTPFSKGKFDEKAMADLIEFHIANGTQGIVPCGTTGESATLTPQEHERVVAVTVEVVNKRIPVIAGTGSNSTDEAIIFTKHAKASRSRWSPSYYPVLQQANTRRPLSSFRSRRQSCRSATNPLQHSWANQY